MVEALAAWLPSASGQLQILPELIVGGAGLLLLVLPRLRSGRLMAWITLGVLLVAFDLKLLELIGPKIFLYKTGFFNMLIHDRFGRFFELAILGSMVLVTLSVMGYARAEIQSRRECYALLLLSTLGMLFLAGAQHLALIYLGLELVSIFSYLLTGFLKKEQTSIEGALKYFLFGALATGAMLYGISLVYGLTGTLHLMGIAAAFPKVMSQAPVISTVALLLLIVGMGFKIALVPFHMWAPDAYEGAPTPVTTFLSLAPKLAGFAVLTRILMMGLGSQAALWTQLLGVLAVVTMTFGNLVALKQTNVKRLLAYSSIAHAGTLLIGLAVATPLGMTALLYYLVAYLLMNGGAFLAVIAVGNATGREDLGAFSGLSRRSPALAFMMAVCLFSLAGVPPLAGFFGKMWLFGAALQAGAVGLAVAAALNSVVAFFYYIRVVKTMYLEPVPAEATPILKPMPLWVGLVACVVGLFWVGLWQGPWLGVAAHAQPLQASSASLPFTR